MKNMGAKSQRAALARWLHEASTDGRPLLIFDFDGTLAPIVRHRESARMRQRTRALLTRIAQAAPTVILSGRRLSDLRARMVGVPVRKLVGNHGAEGLPELSSHLGAKRKVVRDWEKLLRRELRPVRGLDFENKGYSLALHYRDSDNPAAAQIIGVALSQHVAQFAHAKIIHGKQVVDLMPGDLPNKGHAVLELAKLTRATRVIYLGDDTTDEDVFALPLGMGLSGGSSVDLAATTTATAAVPPAADTPPTVQLCKIKVGAGPTRAEYRLARQSDMDPFLSLVLRAVSTRP